MAEIPSMVSESSLWRNTLAKHSDDSDAGPRERLRAAFATFRERAGLLSAEIRKDLPQLTLHDLSHLDALWETASTILGPDYSLTPAEGFVLGGAFLVHDLGMAMPTIDGGLNALKADPRWADLVTYEYQTTLDRDPSQDELVDPEEDICNRVILSLLRQTHAANAERLVFTAFPKEGEAERIHLIDDPEIRQAFGRVIGRVAHSHWWTLSEVERQFERTMGAAHWCPRVWTVDPLKLACVLRCADAAQIDARRAPMLLKATTELPSTSADHWTFQGKLNKPYLEEDALVFTTGHAFGPTDASSWWLCLETLRVIDKELGATDALFADKGSPRFAARRVAGVEEPERLVSYVQTDGWLPINATIHVTDLPRVIKSVGGEELYGKHPEVALRELIQNASDAIRARRIYERREADYGNISVVLKQESEGEYFLEVRDDGIGMSRLVLTSFLLDFGRPFWGSAEMQREFPGLLSSGIKQIGKYGIGFFSVFMIADNVKVTTRRSDAAAKDTLILEFSMGLRGRPILRKANGGEELIEGGTHIRLKLHDDPYKSGGLLYNKFLKEQRSLVDLCTELCPALEVNLFAEQQGKSQQVIAAGDWRTMGSFEFISRLPVAHYYEKYKLEDMDAFRKKVAENVRFLRNTTGEIVGRAFLTTGYASKNFEQLMDLSGVVTVGGLRSCTLSGIAGVLSGIPTRASRDVATPIVSDDELARWASEQAPLVASTWDDPRDQASCAVYIRLCGGKTGDLPIARNQDRWFSAEEIRSTENLPDEIILVDHFVIDYHFKQFDDLCLNDNVFVTSISGIPGLLQCEMPWPREIYTDFIQGAGFISLTLGGALIEAIAEAWGSDPKTVAESNELKKEVDVTIARTGDTELSESAFVIKRPSVDRGK